MAIHVPWARAETQTLWRQTMKKLVVLAAAGLALVSVTAYAQMQHQGSGNQPQTQQRHDGQMGPGMMGSGMMQGGMMHGGMQRGGMHQGGMQHGSSSSHGSTQPKGDNGPSSLAFHGINAKMHEAMNISFTGNADVDFVQGMIPHHQGAIDMAKTVLAFGKDPAVRKLAEEIVKAQEGEIALMKDWLKKNGQ